MNTYSRTNSRKRIGAVLAIVLLIAGVVPHAAFGADALSLKIVGLLSAMQGKDDNPIDIEAKVLSGSPKYYLELESQSSRITVRPAKTGTFDGVDSSNTFMIDVARNAAVGKHTLKVSAYDDVTKALITSKEFSFEVTENKEVFSSLGAASFAVDYEVGSAGDTIIAGKVNTVRFYLFNRGNTAFKNARINIVPPEGISIASGAATINAGYLSIGDRYTAKYDLVADRSVASKSYPFVIKITGLSSTNNEASFEETVYIPVAGTGGSGNLDLEITGVQAPESVSAGSDFQLSFDVVNNSASDAVNVKAELKLPEGVINKTKNVFLIDRIAAGGKASCTVTLSARQGGRYALFEMTAGSVDGTQSVSQYGGTMIAGGSGSANPQLMVSAYSFGGKPVSAGSTFILSLTLNNTSTSTALQNIKVTITSDDSAFLPVGTSNAFYVASIPAGSTYVHPMRLEAKKDADQKTSMVTVNMSYEDASGGTHTSSDIISVPVIQETRLVIDEILDPGYLTADQMGYLNVNYYNMGKTQLSNLRVSAVGEFTADGSSMMYVGNMASGKSDYFSVNFFPNGPGPMSGKVIFTFEDVAGEERTVEKSFTFQIGEAMDWEGDPDMPTPDERPSAGLSTWKVVAILAAAAGGGFGVMKYRKTKKRNRDEEFNLDE